MVVHVMTKLPLKIPEDISEKYMVGLDWFSNCKVVA